uniref:Ig-like domain-containing protein n=1 Tax=Megaselia scalaris TaxID=36166 RepID=T1GFA7_MEGSC
MTNIIELSPQKKKPNPKTGVPPDILDYPTSTDMVIGEGSNTTLKCAATGSPEPVITWRRENGEPIPITSGQDDSISFWDFVFNALETCFVNNLYLNINVIFFKYKFYVYVAGYGSPYGLQ